MDTFALRLLSSERVRVCTLVFLTVTGWGGVGIRKKKGRKKKLDGGQVRIIARNRLYFQLFYCLVPLSFFLFFSLSLLSLSLSRLALSLSL